MEYPIWDQSKTIGTANTTICGLYMDIYCICRHPEGGFFRVHMKYPDKTIDLGLWVQAESYYCVRRKIPVKSLGTGEPTFCIVPNTPCTDDRKYQIAAGVPFQHIDKIRNGKLFIDNGVFYLVDQLTL